MTIAVENATSALFETHQRAIERSRNHYKEFIDFPQQDVERSIPQRFAKIVQRYPTRLAVDDGARQLTYTELDQASSRVANSLLSQRGPEPGETPTPNQQLPSQQPGPWLEL